MHFSPSPGTIVVYNKLGHVLYFFELGLPVEVEAFPLLLVGIEQLLIGQMC